MRTRWMLVLGSLTFVGIGSAQGARPSDAPLATAPEFEAEPGESVSVGMIFDGAVFLPDGSPAVGAVVVSSAGGEAITDESGGYRLLTRVPLDADRVLMTAVGADQPNLVA